MTWVRAVDAATEGGPEALGGKAHGLVALHRAGLPVPPAFVVVAEACREYLRGGGMPAGLREELAEAVAGLTGAGTGAGRGAGAVAVRSGAAVSMPGMMDTVLGLDPRESSVEDAVASVFDSWNSDRARTYRELHGVPHDLGTAVIVQAMVFGDRDERSGTGVAFSRDPNTGGAEPFGDVLFGHRGEAVVSGRTATLPLRALAEREPAVWRGLADALRRIEGHYRDACYLEFTFESGELWLLQARPGRFAGAAAVRLAVDLAEEGAITKAEALLRVSPQHLQRARTPRLADGHEILARGIGACPGVATGRISTTVDEAVRMAADGPVILVRPETSPHDMSGLAAAAGIVTERGGPASHAAVVARAMGRPAVVGVGGFEPVPGELVTIDGTSGVVVRGRAPAVEDAAGPHLDRLLGWADEVTGDTGPRSEAERLRAARAALTG
ncbi:hypothetical protein GCM10009830_01600 [Glycomyces endophyticus]|uniref:Pyruvate, phosphate dikinase n=1 Tax=Glycomyces endophyticus TaxID=480996 RepID=A0ABN2FVI5_9ACTN